MDYAILELEQHSIRPILDTVLPDNRFMEDIIHIQIAQHGELQFGRYDNFHRECIISFHGVPTNFLDEQLCAAANRSGRHACCILRLRPLTAFARAAVAPPSAVAELGVVRPLARLLERTAGLESSP